MELDRADEAADVTLLTGLRYARSRVEPSDGAFLPQKTRSHPPTGMELPVAITQDPSEPLRPPARARTDIFWPSLMWAGGTELSWQDRTVADTLGILRGRDAQTTAADAAYAVLGDTTAIDLLASLMTWGTTTAEQLYALTGHPYDVVDSCAWARQPMSLRRLWLAGVIERGTSISPAAELPVTVRIRKGKGLAALLRRLDVEQLAWVTSDRAVTSPTRGDRHNLLATELGLLISEHCFDLTAVTGPATALLHELDVSGRTPAGRSGADLVVHVEDGLRIGIELTASANPNSLRTKIHRWCDYLARADDEDLGVRVMWLDAGDPHRQTPAEIWSPLTRLIRDELEARPPLQSRRIADRLYVARWRDWIGPNGPTDGLTWMRAFRWYGTWDEAMTIEPWGGCGFSGNDEMLAAVQSASRSAGCPAVLRAAGHPPTSAP